MGKGFVNLLIKPTNLCNLKCIYCFSNDHFIDKTILDIKTFEKFLILACKECDNIQIIWHGGEPTLVGLSFYEKAFKIIKDCANKYKVTITQSIQSNCVNINDDFINLFQKNNVRWGSSFDGKYNDCTRGKTQDYLNSISRFKNHNINVGAICVITKKTVNKLLEIYEDFRLRKQSVTFRPIIIDGLAKNSENDLSVSLNDYFENIKTLFNYWFYDTTCYINVNPFLEYITLVLSEKPRVCSNGSCIGNWFCLEPNGDITPCNRTFPTEYKYGNVLSLNKFSDLYNSKGMSKLLDESIERRSSCKNTCRYFKLCNGGCNHEALINGDITKNGGYSCKLFIKIIDMIKQEINNYLIDKKPINPTLQKIFDKYDCNLNKK